jgi:peptide/nickel transport system permease protein
VLRFTGGQALRAIPVLLAVTALLAFTINLIPGDPGRSLLGPHASQERVEALNSELGVDRPFWDQYASYLDRLGQGSLGRSLLYQREVGPLIADRLPVTLWLLAYTTLLIVAISVPLSLLAAARAGGIPDHLVRGVMACALGVPSAVVGLLLIQFLAVENHVLPVGGFGSGFLGHLESMFLPSLTLALSIVPLVVRSLRAAMLRIIGAEHVTTARAKGLSSTLVWRRHILRNSLIPAVAVVAINLAFVVGGAVVVEFVFSIQGLGSLLLSGIKARDFTVVQSVTLVFAVLVIVINLLSDLIQAALDPRIKLS